MPTFVARSFAVDCRENTKSRVVDGPGASSSPPCLPWCEVYEVHLALDAERKEQRTVKRAC
eukprot:958950-Amphidinium_carterae.1